MEINIEKEIRKAVAEQLHDMDTAGYQEDQVLTAYEALEYFGGGLSYATLMRECRKGNIPCFRIGTKVFFRRNKLLEWIRQQEEGGKRDGRIHYEER